MSPLQNRNHGDHWQIKVRKDGVKSSGASKTIYNITGPNARFNINSQDNSINVLSITPDNLFDKLCQVISSNIEGEEQTKLLSEIEELKESQGSNNFLTKYQEFIAIAANHMTLIAPFIPALTQLLNL